MARVVVWRPSIDPTLEGVQLQWCHEVVSAVPTHFHDTWQVGLIEEGELEVEVRERRATAGAGDLVVFNANEPHRLSGPATPVTARILELRPAVVRQGLELDEERPLPYFPDPVVKDEAAADALRNLHRALQAGHSAGSDLRGQLDELVCHLAAQHGREEVPRAPGCSLDLEAVEAHLRDHLADKTPLDDLAALAGGSRYQVVRRFKQAYGMPPLAYQLQLRLHRAKELLAEGQPAAEVAFATGFADQSHLHRHFRKHTLLTPGAFARQVNDERPQ